MYYDHTWVDWRRLERLEVQTLRQSSVFMNRLRFSLNDPEYHGIAGPLYHYTSLEAFLSIVESRSLWATSVHYLNDANESELGLSLLKKTVDALLPEARGVENQFLQYLKSWFMSDFLRSASAYALCFSESRNQLSQWRGYSRHGRGIAIGFDCGYLIELMQKQGWMFHSCRYTRASQQAWVNAILSRLLREASEKPESDDFVGHFYNVMVRNLSELMQIMATIKDEAFIEEKEVRFISPLIEQSDKAIQFRVGNSTLIPYVDFKLALDESKPMKFADLIIGPSHTQDLTLAAVQGLLTQRNIASNAIGFSNIPYREL